MSTPRCEHCSYELSGIDVHQFMVRCPECGNVSDIRRSPPPKFPWWHTPVALLAAYATYASLFGIIVLVHWLLGPRSPDLTAMGLVMPAVAAAIAMLTLRRNYAALWRFRYGTTHWPIRGIISLVVDWMLWTIVISFLPMGIAVLVRAIWP
ncbi:MAG TPA: hypothetical protein VHC70_06675 [Phycisphaerales bacterium]|jgi:hypothetical protein|nr:hypothetical protein [Phycisphaerales bacterium]